MNIIGEIVKHAAEKIVVQLVEHNGELKVDVRTYFLPSDFDWKPTRKGISIDVDSWPEMKRLMDALDAEVQKLEPRDA